MRIDLQMELQKDKKYFEYFKENSYYFKYFNRGSITYKSFVDDMKIKYKERTSDKVSSFIDNIDMVSSLMDTFK